MIAQPPITGSGKLAVAVHDLRPDVVTGEDDLDYVGMQRGGFGNPFDVATESGNPLADDWAFAVSTSMTHRGFTVTPVATKPQDKPEEVVRKLQATGAPALLLFVLHKWHSDTYNNVTLHHDVGLNVLSSAGAVLAEARLEGSTELGGDLFDPPSHAKTAVPGAFQRKLEILLGNANVVRAILSATGSAPSAAPPAHSPPS